VRPQSGDDKSYKKEEEEEEEVRMGSVWLMDAGRTERGWSNVDTTRRCDVSLYGSSSFVDSVAGCQ